MYPGVFKNPPPVINPVVEFINNTELSVVAGAENWTFQVKPPFEVFRIVPNSPTANPEFESRK
jgi:hypothetical protein